MAKRQARKELSPQRSQRTAGKGLRVFLRDLCGKSAVAAALALVLSSCARKEKPNALASRPESSGEATVRGPEPDRPGRADLDRQAEEAVKSVVKYPAEHPVKVESDTRARVAPRPLPRKLEAEVAFAVTKREARRLAAAGDFEGALTILREVPRGVSPELENEVRAEMRRIADEARRRIVSAISAAERSLSQGDREGARSALGELDRIRFSELETLASQSDALRSSIAEAERKGAVAPAGGAQEGLATLLAEFEALVEKGDFAGAGEWMEHAVGREHSAGEAQVLRAAGRVARLLEKRREAIRRGAEALLGREAALETTKGVRRGKVEEVTGKGIALAVKITKGRQVLGQTRLIVRWADLTSEEADRLTGGWKPQGPEGEIALAVVALSRGDRDAAERAIRAAEEHPLAGHLQGRIDAMGAGAAEAAARAAWAELERRLGAGKPSAAEARDLLKRIAEFEEGHGETRFAASIEDKLAGARSRAQAAVAVPEPSPNYALDFAGEDNRVVVPDRDELDITGPMTLEAWIRPTASDLADGSGEHHIISHLDHPHSGYVFYLTNWRTYTALTVRSCTDGGIEQHEAGVQALISEGAWAHVAVAYDGSHVRLFVNGRLRKTVARTFTILATTKDLGIGGLPTGGGNQFDGSIDEVRISNVCRYTAGFRTQTKAYSTDAHTVALWHMDEGRGAVLSDATGRHGGVFRGEVKWVPGCPSARGAARPGSTSPLKHRGAEKERPYRDDNGGGLPLCLRAIRDVATLLGPHDVHDANNCPPQPIVAKEVDL